MLSTVPSMVRQLAFARRWNPCQSARAERERTWIFRWFHPNETSGDSKPHLCCKLSTSKSWDWVGFRYERQMSLHLCMSELRPVQPNVCCRVRDDLNSMAFHIRQARSEGYMRAYYGKEPTLVRAVHSSTLTTSALQPTMMGSI